jgi:anti-anti-sigma factor
MRHPSEHDLSIDPAEVSDGEIRLVLRGELDLAFAPRLAEAIATHARAGRKLVLDLAGLRFMDSSGLAEILKAHNEAELAGWELAIATAPGAVDRIFDLTDTRRLLNFVES